jgi:16S rRNA (uracil1498-N3)-methyltransferase
LLKSARFEWILEKGTELGVAVFAPILCHRSMGGLKDAGAAKNQRWQRIIQEATEQCGRTIQPALLPIRTLKQALEEIPTGALAIMPWEEAEGNSLRDVLAGVRMRVAGVVIPQTILLFIGPEGGLTPEETALARQHGAQIVTLGQRILRAETAALASVANVMFALEP